MMKFDGFDGFEVPEVRKNLKFDEKIKIKKNFVKICKMMENIIISNLHRFLDFYLNRNGQNWPFYDFIKIGKNRKKSIKRWSQKGGPKKVVPKRC